ncbi:FMRFamide receptor [Toxocara canis]|uniref:FMRFamide receptor n=1 Tax=Toxocara canis TaxID=6265 RepID=A0A0B2UP27_TOXCA|nr:FMRFamide receptor [Toxocara canis]
MEESGQLGVCMNTSRCRIISISSQVPLSWALPLYGYVMPVIVNITLATNSFIVIVLSKKELRTPTNYVLLAMALSELLTGLSCVPWLLYYYTFQGFETDHENGLPAFWCMMFPYMAFILPSIFHTAAIWLTVYLAVQRYIYICVPKLVRGYCTIRRSKQVIVMICFTAVWIYAPDTFVTYNRSFPAFDHRLNRSVRHCVRMRTSFIDALGDDVYYFIVYGLHTTLVHLLPSILLVIFTWSLLRAIRIADKRHANLLSMSSTRRKYSETSMGHKVIGDNNMRRQPRVYRLRSCISESKRVQGLKQNTRMLIVVILLFLFTEIPAAFIFATHVGAVGFRINAVLKYYGLINKLLIVRNVLIVISYPFRFAVYCGMSQQFREVFRQMFTKKVLFWKKFIDERELSSSSYRGRHSLIPDKEISDDMG